MSLLLQGQVIPGEDGDGGFFFRAGELVNPFLQAFAGIGGGGMTTIVSILMSDIIPLRERGTWQGILNIVFASGAACGAPLGMYK